MLDMASAARSVMGPTVDSATCNGIGSGGLSRPNEVRGVAERVGAHSQAQLDERGVAGPGERFAQ